MVKFLFIRNIFLPFISTLVTRRTIIVGLNKWNSIAFRFSLFWRCSAHRRSERIVWGSKLFYYSARESVPVVSTPMRVAFDHGVYLVNNWTQYKPEGKNSRMFRSEVCLFWNPSILRQKYYFNRKQTRSFHKFNPLLHQKRSITYPSHNIFLSSWKERSKRLQYLEQWKSQLPR